MFMTYDILSIVYSIELSTCHIIYNRYSARPRGPKRTNLSRYYNSIILIRVKNKNRDNYYLLYVIMRIIRNKLIIILLLLVCLEITTATEDRSR